MNERRRGASINSSQLREERMSRIVLVSCVVLLTVGPVASAQQQTAGQSLTLGFDGLADLSLNVDDFGVHFTGAQVLACGGSLNCPQFPPYSGSNVIYDIKGFGGGITATFNHEITGDVPRVSARITGNHSITMTAYDARGKVLDSVQTGGANYVGSGTGLPPNMLLEVVSNSAPIARVVFHDGGNTYTIDDFSFQGTFRTVVIDPGHGQILIQGVPTYQRPPSPTYGLIEDVLTLDIANSAKGNLQQAGTRVLLTRSGSLAPFAPPNCGVPCFADLNKRARWAEKQEPDLMVSIHTNAGPPTAHGSESFYSTVAPSPKSRELAESVLSPVVSLGLTDRGTSHSNFNIINTSMPSALIECAFHSNSTLASGQAVTDEAQLNSAPFRADLGHAISQGVVHYYETH